MPKERVTLKDIASELNISIGTVDRAINGRGRIKEETRLAVVEKIAELGYKPNKIASALAKKAQMRIALVTPAHNAFWTEVINGARDACDELADFGVEIEVHSQVSDYDTLGQLREMESIIPTKPDGIIIAPLHPYLLLVPISSAVEQEIPVITVNIDMPDSKRTCYVGENSSYTGALVGDLFGRFLGGTGDIVLLSGDAELSHFQERKTGFLNVMQAKYPGVHVVGSYEFADNGDVAYEIAKSLILQNPNLRGIFSNISIGAMAIGRAIRDTGSVHRVVSIGYDISDFIFELLEQNVMLATVTQSPYLQGYQAAKLMHKILLEKQAPIRECNYVQANIILDRGQCDIG